MMTTDETQERMQTTVEAENRKTEEPENMAMNLEPIRKFAPRQRRQEINLRAARTKSA
jgi:hypothetical protein